MYVSGKTTRLALCEAASLIKDMAFLAVLRALRKLVRHDMLQHV
jgi:hypothetical protein